MVGIDDLRQLLTATTDAGVKTVLVGDAHQLAPVKARGGLAHRLRGVGSDFADAVLAAKAAVHNRPIAPGGSTAQMHHLTGVILDAMLRVPLQQGNTVALDADLAGGWPR